MRATHGLAGAESLAKSTGVTRRQAARIKRDELVMMERERKARCANVRVTQPGVIRASVRRNSPFMLALRPVMGRSWVPTIHDTDRLVAKRGERRLDSLMPHLQSKRGANSAPYEFSGRCCLRRGA